MDDNSATDDGIYSIERNMLILYVQGDDAAAIRGDVAQVTHMALSGVGCTMLGAGGLRNS